MGGRGGTVSQELHELDTLHVNVFAQVVPVQPAAG